MRGKGMFLLVSVLSLCFLVSRTVGAFAQGERSPQANAAQGSQAGFKEVQVSERRQIKEQRRGDNPPGVGPGNPAGVEHPSRYLDRKEDFRDRREDFKDRREDFRDRREDIRDRREDVRDRLEDIYDRRHQGGPRDRLEDIRDRREDVKDRREDFRDRREDFKDRREDIRDRREDIKDRREDIKDRREDFRERREDYRDKPHHPGIPGDKFENKPKHKLDLPGRPEFKDDAVYPDNPLF